jgi:hypothetical protein
MQSMFIDTKTMLNFFLQMFTEEKQGTGLTATAHTKLTISCGLKRSNIPGARAAAISPSINGTLRNPSVA